MPMWATWPLIVIRGFTVAFALVFEAVRPGRRLWRSVLIVGMA